MIAAIITGFIIAITALFTYCFSFLQIIFKKPIPPKGAVQIDSKQHIYAHPDYTDHLLNTSTFNIKTLYDVILRGLKFSKDKPHFLFRKSSGEPFQSFTHQQVFDKLKEIGSGIVSVGLKPSNETFIGIYASTSVNYALCLYSTWPYSMVPIGIYDSLGRDGVQFIIRHAEVELIFADDLQRVRNLIEWKDDKLALKIIVSILEPTEELFKSAEEKHLKLLSFEQLQEIGRNNLVEVVPPRPNDTAVIMYTSGSTGEPKGCVITHENFVNILCAHLVSFDYAFKEDPTDTMRMLNYLPLSHMYGCATILLTTYLGGNTGFWQGKVDKIMDDFRDFQPTTLMMVPRLLNKLYDKVRLQARSKGIFGRILFQVAIQCKMALIRRGDFSQNTIWDKLIFDKIRQSFGGKVTRVLSGSAPLSHDVGAFIRATFSCPFYEVYAQTECVLCCAQTKQDIEPGVTGIPTSLNHLKLIDVPEKEYYAKDGVGEICVRSPAVFKCYLKNEAKTREAIDEEGWLHTGDIGRWTPNRTMRIVDRKKNMYKLSQGEYVAPEKIEDVYARSRFISQLFVYGDSFEHFLIAIVVLDDDYVKTWSSNENNVESIVLPETNTKLKQTVLDDMNHEGKKRGLMSYEQVKAIEFIKEPFTIENGLLTPTFKARRYAVEKKYKELFQKIYKNAKI